MNEFSNHPAFAALTDLAEGRGPGDSGVRTHVLNCQDCRDQLNIIVRVINLMRSVEAEEVPPPLAERALSIFRRNRPGQHPELMPESPPGSGG